MTVAVDDRVHRRISVLAQARDHAVGMARAAGVENDHTAVRLDRQRVALTRQYHQSRAQNLPREFANQNVHQSFSFDVNPMPAQ
jgi:hypothetical protein